MLTTCTCTQREYSPKTVANLPTFGLFEKWNRANKASNFWSEKRDLKKKSQFCEISGPKTGDVKLFCSREAFKSVPSSLCPLHTARHSPLPVYAEML